MQKRPTLDDKILIRTFCTPLNIKVPRQYARRCGYFNFLSCKTNFNFECLFISSFFLPEIEAFCVFTCVYMDWLKRLCLHVVATKIFSNYLINILRYIFENVMMAICSSFNACNKIYLIDFDLENKTKTHSIHNQNHFVNWNYSNV